MNYKLYPGKKRKNIKFEGKETIITIITPYFRDRKYIDMTVNSVLNQTFPYFEWIIVDDGSKTEEDDKKLDEISKIDNRICIYHKENEGPSAARDFGISKISSKSEYVVFLDADDLIDETFIECAYWTLETHKKADWTYCDTINFSGEEYLWRKSYSAERMKKENILVMTSMIRKNALLEVNGFEIRDKEVYEDWCLWLKLIEKGKFPVRMSFLGFWYRKKPKEESELKKSNESNRKKALSYVNKIAKRIDEKEAKGIIQTNAAIQYPREDYNWERISEKYENIVVPKIKNENKKNILIIIPWMTMGGADKFNLDFIAKANKEKYEFIVLSTEPNKNEWRQEFSEYATIYDLTTFLDRKDWIAFINYIIDKNNIDLILNTNSTFGYAVLPYLKMKNPNIPIVDYIHMEEWYNRNGGFSRDSSAISSVIDKTFVCNKNSEKILVDYFHRKPEDIDTIYIGVDEKKFDSNKYNKEEILEKYKIDIKDKYVVSYICRIAEQKRPFLLLEIIKMISKKRNDILFVIAGDGPLLEKMKIQSKKMGIRDNMIFLGAIKNTGEIYKISDITINCSIKEGLALTAYESLSMGVPVVSTDVGGQKELINSEVGVIVPCLQEEKEILNLKYKNEEIIPYVEGIEKIIKKLEYYKQHARERILQGFTIDQMVINMERQLDSIISENIVKKKNCINKEYIDIAKEMVTKYFIGQKIEYNWLSNEFNRMNIDMGRAKINYEDTIEYKIKHPIYVILTKIHLYDKIKKIIKKGEKSD